MTPTRVGGWIWGDVVETGATQDVRIKGGSGLRGDPLRV